MVVLANNKLQFKEVLTYGGRPNLNIKLDSKTFKKYYYLKEELIDFCRKNNLQTIGGKLELTERIANFLDTGERTYKSHNNRKTIIPPKYEFIQMKAKILGISNGKTINYDGEEITEEVTEENYEYKWNGTNEEHAYDYRVTNNKKI